MDKNEIELIDYLNILWKRKWLILILTSFFILAAGIISFLQPPQWEVDAIIMPSKFLIQIEGGPLKEVLPVGPKQIAGQINQAVYNNLIAAELNLDIRKLPRLKAENIKDTNLVQVSVKGKDIEKAKLILNSLFNHLKKELNAQADIETKGINSEVKSKEIEKLTLEGEFDEAKNELTLIKRRRQDIAKEMTDIRKKTEELEKQRHLILKKKNRSESEILAMLLYSTTIQQNSMNHNTLNELLGSKKNEGKIINLERESKERLINQIKNEIDILNERKGRIDFAQLIKEPTSSLKPVSPKKTINILIAGILGLIIFTLLAFFLEYLEKQRAKSKG